MPAKRRFAAQVATIERELRATMQKMGATGLRVERDLMGRESKIVFDRDGTRYVFSCEKWEHPDDNFRAAQRAIALLYAVFEEYGITRDEAAAAPFSQREVLRRRSEAQFRQLFAGYVAMPDSPALRLGDGTARWWEVLGVAQTATKADVENAFRALARTHHPDTGGSHDAFVRLRRAYEEARAALGVG